MFISDFAIKRPDRHHRRDGRARRSSASSRCCALEHRRVPRRRRRRSSSVSMPYPGRVAGQRRARGRRSDRGGDRRRSAASSKIQSNALDGFGVDHRRVPVREGPAGSDAGDPRRDLRRSATTCRPRWRSRSSRGSIRTTSRSCRWRCRRTTLTGPELTRLADPGDHRAAARRPRRRRGARRRRRRARADRRAATARRCRRPASASAQVVQALQAQNLAAPVGRLNGQLDERTIRLRGRLEKPADFARLVVAQRGGRADPARRRRRRQGRRRGAAHGGAATTADDAVGIDIKKAEGLQHDGRSATRSARRSTQIQKTLPPGVELERRRATPAPRVARLGRATCRRRSSKARCSPCSSCSCSSTPGARRSSPAWRCRSRCSPRSSPCWAFGFTLNTMSLLGLSLAIGILIDDAIVVRENIVRHVEMGKDHYTAAREGTAEIGLAVAATTFSIVVVFVPIAFMGGVAEQWFEPFALTIACSVLVSLFVSFSLDPMLSAYWPDPHVPMEQRSFISRGLDRFNRWFDRQAERYKTRHRLGARPPLRDGGARGRCRSSARWRCRRWASSAASSSRSRTTRSSTIIVETPPGSNLEYTQLKARGSRRASRASMPEVLYTYTTHRRPDRGGRRGHRLRAAEAEGRARAAARTTSRRSCARELARLGGVDGVDHRPAELRATRSRSSCRCAGRDIARAAAARRRRC